MTKTDQLLTESQVAEILGVARVTLTGWRSRKTGPPFVKLARRVVRYPSAKLVAWIESHANVTAAK